jgi:hypothetical protein
MVLREVAQVHYQLSEICDYSVTLQLYFLANRVLVVELRQTGFLANITLTQNPFGLAAVDSA